jgi:hypothetical protein
MVTNQPWELGTAPSGSDGDSARQAGEKYNLHQHPGEQFDTLLGFDTWKTDGSREIGDIAVYLGVSYMWNGAIAVPLSIGPIAVSGTKVEDIVLSTKVDVFEIEPEVPGEPVPQVVACDYLDPDEYRFERWDSAFKFRVVGTCINTDPVYSVSVALKDKTTDDIIYEADIVGIDQPNEVISGELTLADGRHFYEVVVTCSGCDFILYKAAIRVEHTVLESV